MEFQFEQVSSGAVHRQLPVEPGDLVRLTTRSTRGSTLVAWVCARADKLLLVAALGAVASWLFYWFGP